VVMSPAAALKAGAQVRVAAAAGGAK
jgi:hypothetical protein